MLWMVHISPRVLSFLKAEYVLASLRASEIILPSTLKCTTGTWPHAESRAVLRGVTLGTGVCLTLGNSSYYYHTGHDKFSSNSTLPIAE